MTNLPRKFNETLAAVRVEGHVAAVCGGIADILLRKCARGSSVGIATRYGLDNPGIERRWVRDFPHASRPTLGSTQPPIQWVPGHFPVGKQPGRGADHPPHLAPRLKKE